MSSLKVDKLLLEFPERSFNFNFEIFPGEIIGILGPNGCGKTTLLHTLAGLKKFKQGTVSIFENDSKRLSRKQISQQLGILLQDTFLNFPQTVFEYCLSGRNPHASVFGFSKTDVEKTHSALQVMDLEKYENKNVLLLSGGERRRLAIATLLAQDPEIFLLDEPTNHLDLRYQMKLLQHFQFLAEAGQKSILVSLHDLHFARRFCGKVLLIFEDGQVVIGKTKDVLNGDKLTKLYGVPDCIF